MKGSGPPRWGSATSHSNAASSAEVGLFQPPSGQYHDGRLTVIDPDPLTWWLSHHEVYAGESSIGQVPMVPVQRNRCTGYGTPALWCVSITTPQVKGRPGRAGFAVLTRATRPPWCGLLVRSRVFRGLPAGTPPTPAHSRLRRAAWSDGTPGNTCADSVDARSRAFHLPSLLIVPGQVSGLTSTPIGSGFAFVDNSGVVHRCP